MSKTGNRTVDKQMANKKEKPKAGKSSEYTGVYWDNSSKGNGKCHSRWRAAIMVDGVRHRLGRFHDEEEAARAYKEAAMRLRGHTGEPRGGKLKEKREAS